MTPVVTKGSRIRLIAMPDDPDPIPAEIGRAHV